LVGIEAIHKQPTFSITKFVTIKNTHPTFTNYLSELIGELMNRISFLLGTVFIIRKLKINCDPFLRRLRRLEVFAT